MRRGRGAKVLKQMEGGEVDYRASETVVSWVNDHVHPNTLIYEEPNMLGPLSVRRVYAVYDQRSCSFFLVVSSIPIFTKSITTPAN